jgi:hypothetical protein
MRLNATILAFIICAASPYAPAETIEFPEEELATESVLPVFDKTVVVRNRTITRAGRVDFIRREWCLPL